MAEEYIKRSEAINTIFDQQITNDLTKMDRIFNTGLRRAMSVLANLPVADAVPVVRCNDCKFWDREHISVEGLARCQTGETGIRYRKAIDFCSRGDRMDGEAEDND